MDSHRMRKFERYTEAFIEYQIASINFHDAVFKISRDEEIAPDLIKKLHHIFIIKHTHFLERAANLLGKDFSD